MTDPSWNVEVVVVGAGFAGLAAARELTRQGHDVLVLEGRDRVGGRSFTGSVAGLPADMGGTFVGPTQDAVLALADELDIATTPTYNDGKNLIQWRGWARPYRGAIPRLSLTEPARRRPVTLAVRTYRPQGSGGRALGCAERAQARRPSLGELAAIDTRHRFGTRLDGHHGPSDVGMRTG